MKIIKVLPQLTSLSFFNQSWHCKPMFNEVALNLLLQTPEKCPNIVQLLDWFEEDHQHVLILEYPRPCVTLLDYIRQSGGHLSEALARHLMRQAVIACKHCIDHGVFHGDLKIDNVLVNTDTLELKLIDFGCGELVATCGPKGNEYSGELSFLWFYGWFLLMKCLLIYCSCFRAQICSGADGLFFRCYAGQNGVWP